MHSRKWTNVELTQIVSESFSVRQVISKLGLVPAGGNYQHIQRIIQELGLNTNHFLGKGWSAGMKFRFRPKLSIESILTINSQYQSHKLKKRLIEARMKEEKCEICGWNQRSKDGRIPLELDHKNGDHLDNRLENLRILCPNCHSLQSTHRGINKVKYKKK